MEPLVLLKYAAPVAIAALGETISQKAGVLNIGLEGAMLTGAFFGVFTTFSTGSPWLGLCAAMGVGMLLMAISSWFTVVNGADQVVVGTAVNLLALGVTGTLFRAQFGQSGQLFSVTRIPSAGGWDAVLVGLLILIPCVAWLIGRTGWGLALRSAGEYPKATEAAGFSVIRLRFGAMLINGALAGLAGGYLALGISGSFAENMTAGRGFVAIAMVTFGRWRPAWVFGAAVLIGFAESLQFLFQSRGVQAPYQLMIALPYAVALLVLVVVGKGTLAPASLGKPYRKES
jgi:simple sugar transport system permease protein